MKKSTVQAGKDRVYFVVDSRHVAKIWPELAATPDPAVVFAFPERIRSGRDCWTIQTWAYLAVADCPFEPVLATVAVDGAVCVFHWDDAKLAQGVHRCHAIVVKADRPAPPLADGVVVQNGYDGTKAGYTHIPLWGQPGLVPRDVRRGARLATLGYLGSVQYELPFMKSGAFHEELGRRGVIFTSNFGTAWHDYSAIDAVLAVRSCPPVVMATKPASKLVNAWKAGVPALLGPEPAYRELRESSLDFFEVNDVAGILRAIDSLQASPDLYAAMVANGVRRAGAFDVAAISARWVALLEDALAHKPTSGRNPAWRAARFRAGKCALGIWKRLAGWRD